MRCLKDRIYVCGLCGEKLDSSEFDPLDRNHRLANKHFFHHELGPDKCKGHLFTDRAKWLEIQKKQGEKESESSEWVAREDMKHNIFHTWANNGALKVEWLPHTNNSSEFDNNTIIKKSFFRLGLLPLSYYKKLIDDINVKKTDALTKIASLRIAITEGIMNSDIKFELEIKRKALFDTKKQLDDKTKLFMDMVAGAAMKDGVDCADFSDISSVFSMINP